MKNKKVIDIDSEEGEKIMQQILSKPPVVLVGAAISMWNPTNLPLGSKIGNQMFDLLFPKSLFNQEEYKKCKSIIKDYFLGSERKKNENEEENAENKKKGILGLPFEVIFEGCPKGSKQKLIAIFKKAFSIRDCNPVHKALRDHLLSDGFPAIITTNYDLCLDEVLEVSDSNPISSEVVRVIEEHDVERTKTHNKKKIYFKLHGSVDDAEGETLVFSLRQERRLPEWKKRVLYKLFEKHQSLLVIGYSGSDFEICPELFSKESPLKKIFWNIREKPSINAKRFADREDHINTFFLRGDMRDLLSELRGTEVNAKKEGSVRKSLVSYIDSQFNSQELVLWRIALLKRMGLPKPALKDYGELEIHSLTPAERIEAKTMKGRLYFHNGKYKISAHLLEKTAEKAIEIEKAEEAALLLLHASVSYRNYWNLPKASQCIDKAEKIIEKLEEGVEKDWLISRMHMCRAGDLYFRYSFLKFVPWINKKAVERKIRENYCKAAEYAAESGNWTDFYQAALWSKKVGIDIAELTRDMGYIPPPDPAEGYKYLSFYIPQLIRLRHKISQSKGSLKEEKEELKEHIETSKNVGYIPELWKLLLKKIRYDPWRKDVIKDILQFLYYYNTCEYTIIFKPFIPLYYYFF